MGVEIARLVERSVYHPVTSEFDLAWAAPLSHWQPDSHARREWWGGGFRLIMEPAQPRFDSRWGRHFQQFDNMVPVLPPICSLTAQTVKLYI